jgi:hypothetical protein
MGTGREGITKFIMNQDDIIAMRDKVTGGDSEFRASLPSQAVGLLQELLCFLLAMIS